MKNNKVKRSTRIMFYKQHLISIDFLFSDKNFFIEINRPVLNQHAFHSIIKNIIAQNFVEKFVVW